MKKIGANFDQGYTFFHVIMMCVCVCVYKLPYH